MMSGKHGMEVANEIVAAAHLWTAHGDAILSAALLFVFWYSGRKKNIEKIQKHICAGITESLTNTYPEGVVRKNTDAMVKQGVAWLFAFLPTLRMMVLLFAGFIGSCSIDYYFSHNANTADVRVFASQLEMLVTWVTVVVFIGWPVLSYAQYRHRNR